MPKENDRVLRIYREVLELDHLHYGLWEPGDEVTLDNFRRAQDRYEQRLVDSLPEDARSVLDVGCGTCSLSLRLKSAGLDVEGLSPDINQKRLFAEKIGGTFHHCRFEHFKPARTYDCIIMSESPQYIPREALFDTAVKCLRPGGCLVATDYFVRTGSPRVFRKSGHVLEEFLASARQRHFELMRQDDVTDEVLKTLELAVYFYDKADLLVEILTDQFRTRHGWSWKFVTWLFRHKLRRGRECRAQLEPAAFKEHKQYLFLTFRHQPDSPIEAAAAEVPALAGAR